MSPRNPENLRRKGSGYEAIAARYLENLGYEILARNYHARIGEIDLVARDGDVLVFVEVRMRKRSDCGTPLESVNATKIRAITKAAMRYLTVNGIEDVDCRFDVIGILDPHSLDPVIEHVQDAFQADPGVWI